jgi:hypothetical protein
MKCTTAVKADNEITTIRAKFFCGWAPTAEVNGECGITVPNIVNFST